MNHEVELEDWAWEQFQLGHRSAFVDLSNIIRRNVQRGDTVVFKRYDRSAPHGERFQRLPFVVSHVERIGYQVPVASGSVDAWVGAVLHLIRGEGEGGGDA